MARQGRWCVGYLRYEAAPAFDSAFAVHRGSDGPLAWFGVHDAAQPWPPMDTGAGAAGAELAERPAARHVRRSAWRTSTARSPPASCTRSTTPRRCVPRSAAMRWRCSWRCAGRSPTGMPPSSTADDEQCAVRVAGTVLRLARWPHAGAPDEGHGAARRHAGGGRRAARRLAASPKERAENVMIVDLIRNDLSRIAEPFSVRVPRLFHARGAGPPCGR